MLEPLCHWRTARNFNRMSKNLRRSAALSTRMQTSSMNSNKYHKSERYRIEWRFFGVLSCFESRVQGLVLGRHVAGPLRLPVPDGRTHDPERVVGKTHEMTSSEILLPSDARSDQGAGSKTIGEADDSFSKPRHGGENGGTGRKGRSFPSSEFSCSFHAFAVFLLCGYLSGLLHSLGSAFSTFGKGPISI